MEIEAEERFTAPITQSIPDFIACQHSREAFAVHKLGHHRQEFDTGLHARLEPHATESSLKLKVGSRLTHGRCKQL